MERAPLGRKVRIADKGILKFLQNGDCGEFAARLTGSGDLPRTGTSQAFREITSIQA
jgi:hypothetical protein